MENEWEVESVEITLDRLQPGQSCIVADINVPEALSRRLLGFGFVPGTHVKCRYLSPDRGTAAVEFRGAVVALRRSDLANMRGTADA